MVDDVGLGGIGVLNSLNELESALLALESVEPNHTYFLRRLLEDGVHATAATMALGDDVLQGAATRCPIRATLPLPVRRPGGVNLCVAGR